MLGTRLIDGVRVGPVTVSLADVLLAMLVFAVVLGVTRYVQRVLDMRVFPGTKLDAGIRHSLRTGVGYVGLVVAGGLAISTLGLNVSNLASSPARSPSASASACRTSSTTSSRA